MTAEKALLAGSMTPSFDCDAQVLSQCLKGIKGLKFSVITESLLQASSPSCVWLVAKVPLQFGSGLGS